MYYCLYEIRNILNDKIYVGVHKTKNLDDGYMGSGKVIRRAIEKHGVENFTKVILETFEDDASMYAREKEVVTDEFLDREDTYNLRRGGTGGFDFINKVGANIYEGHADIARHHMKLAKSRQSELFKDPAYSKNVRLKISNTLKDKWKQDEFHWIGKNHKESSKQKIGEKNSISQTGIKNSQYGTCWVYNESGNKKIKKDDLQQYLDAGYMKGRLLSR